MKIKRILSLCIAVVLATLCCACGGTGDNSTTATTELVIPSVGNESIKIPLEEAANAIKINATPVEETKKIPLLIVLVNFDA
ncbi:MAG: hypothetical protein J6Q67_08940, partial [Clostridia bacterium]|nr:hypothetical protein [Clostridia bacterium]